VLTAIKDNLKDSLNTTRILSRRQPMTGGQVVMRVVISTRGRQAPYSNIDVYNNIVTLRLLTRA
jgi:hypothetical protein